MILLALVPPAWFRIMDPLVDEYNKTGHGAIKSEVTEKSIKESREFAVAMGLFATGLWFVDFIL